MVIGLPEPKDSNLWEIPVTVSGARNLHVKLAGMHMLSSVLNALQFITTLITSESAKRHGDLWTVDGVRATEDLLVCWGFGAQILQVSHVE